MAVYTPVHIVQDRRLLWTQAEVEVENENPFFIQPRKIHPDKQAESNRLVTDFRRINDITKQSPRFGKTRLWIFDCIEQFQYHIARHLFTWDFDNGGHCTIGM